MTIKEGSNRALDTADKDMSDSTEAVDILWELMCKDSSSRSRRDASDKSSAKQKHSPKLTDNLKSEDENVCMV